MIDMLDIQFLEKLKEITDIHNQNGYIDDMSGCVTYYIDQYLSASSEISSESEIKNIILAMENQIQKIKNDMILVFENEKKAKEKSAQKLKEDHMKFTGCGEVCDCATKAIADYKLIDWNRGFPL